MAAVWCDVDHHLHLRVIEQPAIARAIMTLGEVGLEPLNIQTTDAGLFLVDAAEEPDFAFIGEQVGDFVILRFVDQITIGVLDATDLMNVLLDA
jgi:hypothetical protein